MSCISSLGSESMPSPSLLASEGWSPYSSLAPNKGSFSSSSLASASLWTEIEAGADGIVSSISPLGSECWSPYSSLAPAYKAKNLGDELIQKEKPQPYHKHKNLFSNLMKRDFTP